MLTRRAVPRNCAFGTRTSQGKPRSIETRRYSPVVICNRKMKKFGKGAELRSGEYPLLIFELFLIISYTETSLFQYSTVFWTVTLPYSTSTVILPGIRASWPWRASRRGTCSCRACPGSPKNDLWSFRLWSLNPATVINSYRTHLRRERYPELEWPIAHWNGSIWLP